MPVAVSYDEDVSKIELGLVDESTGRCPTINLEMNHEQSKPTTSKNTVKPGERLIRVSVVIISQPNAQLTDGGPPGAFELSTDAAGPSFGASVWFWGGGVDSQ